MAFGEADNSVCDDVLCRKRKHVVKSDGGRGEGNSVRQGGWEGLAEKVICQLIPD